jgi:4-hydroxy-2-oxoheptanedioate aldolase
MNRIREIWASGGTAVVGWLQIPAALPAEALARCGYDGLVLDLQHSPIDYAAAIEMITAIEVGGTLPMARLAANEPAEVMKLLDSGALGIIAPMIESAAEAERLAKALHYPPRGSRSFGPRRPSLKHGSSYHSIASETFVSFAMIETAEGIRNLDEILATDGIDGVFIGPSDLALALGRTPAPDSGDPLVVDTIRRIRERAHSAGKRAAIFCVDPAFARARAKDGFDLVTLAPDLSLLVQAATESLAQMRGTPS